MIWEYPCFRKAPYVKQICYLNQSFTLERNTHIRTPQPDEWDRMHGAMLHRFLATHLGVFNVSMYDLLLGHLSCRHVPAGHQTFLPFSKLIWCRTSCRFAWCAEKKTTTPSIANVHLFFLNGQTNMEVTENGVYPPKNGIKWSFKFKCVGIMMINHWI